MPAGLAKHPDVSDLIPSGYLVTRSWLLAQGVGNHTLDNLIKSRQLVALAQGVYRRPEAALTWQSVVASLQRMGSPLVVGGLTALEDQGLAHYLPLGSQRTIHLYGAEMPGWINEVGVNEQFAVSSTRRLFVGETVSALTVALRSVDSRFEVKASSPERAILEVLDDVPDSISFEHADQLMQGLTTLSPRRLDQLLRETRNVKVKRLFFWLADRQRHAWLARLKSADYDLGSGKRVVAKGGQLDRAYQITVPRDMHG